MTDQGIVDDTAEQRRTSQLCKSVIRGWFGRVEMELKILGYSLIIGEGTLYLGFIFIIYLNSISYSQCT